ncbi:MAG TPA: CorA family divalent cation transporter [Cytophagaceae bacterium]|jgi:magnesium transporter|nr:CorA family divalent cation transporter [Cytophagaceae bacterium]
MIKRTLLDDQNNTPAIWIDLCNPTAEELSTVSKEYHLHENTVIDCLDPGHLPKYENIQECHFLIIRSYFPSSSENPHTIQDLTSKIAIFYSHHFLITIHRRENDFLNTVQEKFCDPQLSLSIKDLVIKIVWSSLHSFDRPAIQLSGETDDYEEKIFLKNVIPQFQKKLYYLKHKANVSKKVLLLTSEVISHIHNNVNNPSSQDLKDLHLKLITIYDQIQEDVNNLLNVYISLSAQKTNEIVKVLTILSVFFMPLTFIAGIYGMNFAYMPELNNKFGYPIVLILMGIVSMGIFVWVKQKKWL